MGFLSQHIDWILKNRRNCYRKGYLRNSKLTLSIDQEAINRELNPKLLGITFDPSINFKDHFKILLDKCNKISNLIRILSHHATEIEKSNLLKVYSAYIRSLIIYSFVPYKVSSDSTKSKIQIMQNEALRSVTHIYRSSHTRVTRLHEICKMPLVEDMIRKAINSYPLKTKKNKDLKDIIYLLIEEAKKILI